MQYFGKGPVAFMPTISMLNPVELSAACLLSLAEYNPSPLMYVLCETYIALQKGVSVSCLVSIAKRVVCAMRVASWSANSLCFGMVGKVLCGKCYRLCFLILGSCFKVASHWLGCLLD
jgi:hypothetical protein